MTGGSNVVRPGCYSISMLAIVLASTNHGCIQGGCLTTSESVIGVRVYDNESHGLICDADVRATKTPSRTQFAFVATTSVGSDAAIDCGYAGGTEPGQYEVQVSKSGFRTATATVDVPSTGEDRCGRGLPQRVTVALSR